MIDCLVLTTDTADRPLTKERPRIVPTFHSAGPVILQTDSPNRPQADQAQQVIKWLEADLNRFWATMMNYAGDAPITKGSVENYYKYRDVSLLQLRQSTERR